ncbi:hypothetical protein PIB30_096209 [Stylosanthes scabra]|uniref:Uncharacterized protein n=1 Tax=Stylosanthes scabra TaxID=79078 RepID=A0ABU6SW92_9FABA|nr:hypothetical protein [Stylosanthes scabra]
MGRGLSYWKKGVLLMRVLSVFRKENRTSCMTGLRSLVGVSCTMLLSNFSVPSQPHVFLRGKKIPFSKEDIGRHLHIPYELPPAGEDDIFKMTVKAYNDDEINMDGVFKLLLLLMENIDPKTHGTTFLMEHALLIYVLIKEGIVNLPMMMRDIMLKRST